MSSFHRRAVLPSARWSVISLSPSLHELRRANDRALSPALGRIVRQVARNEIIHLPSQSDTAHHLHFRRQARRAAAISASISANVKPAVPLTAAGLLKRSLRLERPNSAHQRARGFYQRCRRKEPVHESVGFARKAARWGEFMALAQLIGGGQGGVPQVLQGIVRSACLWMCLGIGLQHEQS